MTLTKAVLRLRVEGFRKPLRLRPLRSTGALEAFAIEGEALEAVRFYPAGAVRETDGNLTAIPEAETQYAAALDAFEALGRRLQAMAPSAVLPVQAVTRGPSGGFWFQPPTGATLETWLAQHPAPVVEPVAAAFARRLALALEELHAAGVIHGDLSPRAVLIDHGEVRLTGFMVDRRPFFRPLRSQLGLVEPGYAPPEAHDGAQRHPIGPAADLYAASALLQRLLTGRPPPPATARVAGDDAWPSAATSAGLRAGIEAGLAPVASERPASATAWLAGLDLGPEPDDAPWFEGLASTPPETPPPEPETDPLALPPLPMADLFEAPADAVEAPLTIAREAPARRRWGWWAGGLSLAALAIAAVALVAPRLNSRPSTPPAAAAPKVAAPVAPTGCQWLSAGGVWRLRCADAPAQGLRLPERFDAQTTARAAAGEPAAMERLGAFYRLRASETANPNRSAHAYQALDWLQRAAGAADDGRPETARARDDAALALGQMLARGEGGRAPDPAAAETRLRQAAAGSRADAVLALAQLLEAQAGDDADRLVQARGLYARVAQLGDGSLLQREGERGLARIDAATKPPPVEPPPEPPIEEKPAPAPKPVPRAKTPATKPPAKVLAKPPPAKAAQPAPPVVRAPPKTATPPRRHPTVAPAPSLRTWTTSTFIKVDPTTNFYPALELAGRAACDSEGGETLSVRAGDTNCPNGVNYCQVRAVATCQGARP
ncbi:hypothetical protein [Caulobacter sp.]|uniref:protein kinase domain-containing protein n=1 Tax=Caulobacter sp. TaxID=78 RepID=UPI001B220842|nr:hypothetical protein [Caulobacter sp.]MBO9546332.1 hypothetical protein [Caulobacter sp.]